MARSPLPYSVFDGHNDALLRLQLRGRDRQGAFLAGDDEGHLDLPRARAGGFGGGFFAVFVPSDPADTGEDEEGGEQPPIHPVYARDAATAMIATLFRLAAASKGRMRVVRTVDDLARCLRKGVLAAVLHFEGAEPIDPDLDALEVFYQAGLRSLGIAWSRPNLFGYGVPFRFPHGPDTGPGLTEAGARLVHACNRLGIMVDLSHLNERGFWDVARLSSAPLVATHSNAHALCPSSRNLTDDQLAAIRDSDGLVGLNFGVAELREDGREDASTPIETMVRHLDYLVQRLGIDRVGFGSDFDGTIIPEAVGDVTGLPRLLAALAEHGYDAAALRKLAHENWLRVLRLTWRHAR